MKAATLAKAARRAPGKSNRAAGWRTLRLACWLLLALAACEDKGKAEYQAAYERYQALVNEGRLPSDPAFDEVLKQLDAVPTRSAASGKAKSLREAIQRSRRRLAPKPLANAPSRPDAGVTDPKVLAKQQECAQLAAALGTAAPDAREAARKRLEACQAELRRLEEQGHEDAPR